MNGSGTANGAGTVHYDKERATWYVKYRYPDPRGKEKNSTKRGFKKKKDAELWLRQTLGNIENGTHVPYDRQTVRDFFVGVWLPAIEPLPGSTPPEYDDTVSVGTYATYRHDVLTYIVPNIGSIPLQKLTKTHLDGLYSKLIKTGRRDGTGLSVKSVQNVHGVVHRALDHATREGMVSRNVADAAKRLRSERRRTDTWDVEELRKFLIHVADDRLYAAWLLLATTGMRRGEVAGLSWGDIDFEKGTVRVDWTLGQVSGKPTWKPKPKTKAGERTMAVDPETLTALRKWGTAQKQEKLVAGAGWVKQNTDWRGVSRESVVFTRPDGRMITPDLMTEWFQEHCRAAGLPRIRLHDVRHTYATAGLANATGWHEVKVISERLGHANVGITLDVYSHVLPAADEQVAHTLARVILGEA